MGEARAEDAWYGHLRERFVQVAARRVEDDAVEDLVQEALRIVHEKTKAAPGSLVDGRPALAWCFQVLRNVIGNHYQRRGKLAKTSIEGRGLKMDYATPLDRLEREERRRLIRDALSTLHRRSHRCGEYLKRVLGGASPASIAATENLAPAVVYRRLYRCREHLRAILAAQGVRP